MRREIVQGRAWLGWMVNVVEDRHDLLATYSPAGSPFCFPEGDWPTSDGRHPWHDYEAWQGDGALMLQRPGDRYAVWHFWDRSGDFRGWYINLEAPFERTEIGFDTQDLELDIWIAPDRTWEFKDIELLWQRHEEGRFTVIEVRRILELGEHLGNMIDSGEWWWDGDWHEFEPDPNWTIKPMPIGWESVPSIL